MELLDEYYCPFCASDLIITNKSGYKKTLECTSHICPYKYTYIDSKAKKDAILESFLTRIKRLNIIRI